MTFIKLDPSIVRAWSKMSAHMAAKTDDKFYDVYLPIPTNGQFFDRLALESLYDDAASGLGILGASRVNNSPYSIIIIMSRSKDFTDSFFDIALPDLMPNDRLPELAALYRQQWDHEFPGYRPPVAAEKKPSEKSDISWA